MTTRKCKYCNGTGLAKLSALRIDSGSNTTVSVECKECEGSGIVLRTKTEEQFDDAAELNGTKIHQDEVGFIDLEEEDYEV